jgi:hypothetical protein
MTNKGNYFLREKEEINVKFGRMFYNIVFKQQFYGQLIRQQS